MRVFMTGATGWVGRVAVDDLLGAGHQVVALSRSDEKAAQLTSKGAEVVRGTLDDVDLLADAAAKADAVIHLAFDHDFSRFADNAEQERKAIEAMGGALVGTDKPLLYTAGLLLLTEGRVSAETDMPPVFDPKFPRMNETAGVALSEKGVRVAAIRLAPSVHGMGDQMFMAFMAGIARATGVSAYVGDGSNRWPAIHVSDAGKLYRKVLESGVTSRAYHGAAEEGVRFKDIAEAIGRALNLPVEPRPAEHFGALAVFAASDSPASSAFTRKITGWEPTGPTLLEDLGTPGYFPG